jgi:uncharacterized membrane protein YsdA (DUF1294 family)
MVYLYGFVLLNLLTFLITAYDKQLAVAHKNRFQKKLLLTFAAVGGTIGAAMYLFRHKTSKKYYLLNFTES